MMKKKRLITYLVLLAIVAAVVLITVSFELESRGSGTAPVMQYLSDGFFSASVLYIGCSILMLIQDAGNFYGIQYLFYTVFRLFSYNKRRYEERKNYFTYCMEKKERREAEGESPLKSAMLVVGLGCLAVSVTFVLLFYRMA